MDRVSMALCVVHSPMRVKKLPLERKPRKELSLTDYADSDAVGPDDSPIVAVSG